MTGPLYFYTMMKIGLTGGIGSGKSTVAQIFLEMGVPVFISDTEARTIQDTDPEVKAAIAELFGKEIYTADGKLDRAKTAAAVFADKEKLAKLNAIVHPAVAKAFDRFCEMHKDAPYVIKEAAILFELGLEKQLDKMITVIAPDELRIKRVLLRDKTDEESIRKRFSNQMPQEEKAKRSDFVIVNNEKELLIPQVVKINSALKGA